MKRKSMMVMSVFFLILGLICNTSAAQNEMGRGTLSDDNFQADSAGLKPEADKVLQKILATLRSDPNLGLRIEGYSTKGDAGTEADKLALQRAQAVMDWFVNRGIASGRLEAKTTVDSSTTAGSSAPAAGTLSRRVEILTIALKSPVVFFPETSYTFDPVVDGVYVTYDFVFQNKGDGLLKINRVRTG